MCVSKRGSDREIWAALLYIEINGHIGAILIPSESIDSLIQLEIDED